MLVLLGSLSACAPRDAGFGSVQVLLEQRAGLDVRWRYLDGPTDETVAEMLAQPVGPEEAVRIALLNNRDLQASFEELGIARASLLGASLPPNIEVDFDRHRVPGAKSEFSFAATIDLSRVLFLSMRRGVVSAELDAVRFQTTGTLLGFAQAVRTAYYDYQAAEQLLELIQTVLEAAAASYDVAQRLHEAGNITALELANERAFYEESRSQIALSEAVTFSRREELTALMGLSGMETHWQLAGRLVEPPEESPHLANLEARAIEQSLDLVALEHRYVGAARRANLARAEGLLPTLRAGIHMDSDEGLREFGPVISFDLPVFDQGQAGVALAIRIRATVRTARNALLIAGRRVDHYQDVLLPLREQIVEQTQRQYNAMELGVFQLIVARRDQVRTAQEYVIALRGYWHARATLDRSWPAGSCLSGAISVLCLRVWRCRELGEKRLRMISRRNFVMGSWIAGGGLLAARPAVAQAAQIQETGYTSVVTPNGVSLPFRMVEGVKVFHLISEPVEHEFASGLKASCWGYNGRTSGPTIEAVEGDRVRIYVTNRLPEPTTVHWHGIILPNGMDGVGGLTQPYIRPGETFRYEFPFLYPGTFMYHPHVDEMTQMGMGLMGMIVVHERNPQYPVDRDFAIMLSEWYVPIGTRRPDPREMSDFNVLTMNSKAFPGTDPLVVRTGQRVRMRFGNLSAMDNHPIHLHGYSFKIAGTDGGRIAETAQQPETTVLVPVGATRDIEFVADAPGDWAMHCHFTHHIMNQMGHEGPNMIGLDTDGLDGRIRPLLPGYMTMGQSGMSGMGHMGMDVPDNSIPMVGAPGKHDYLDMGGMFTVLKVRDDITSYQDPGWYDNPPGTLARQASSEELKADGISV